jgi:uncharacterized membrane protein
MNRYGLKQAAKQCLADADCSPALVTLVYFLVALVISAPSIVYSLFLDNGLSTAAVDAELYLDDIYLAYYQALLPSLILGVVATLWQTGYDSFCLRLSRRQSAGIGNLLDGFRLFGKVIWLTILIGFFTYLWSLLFIIPGIVAAYRYRMAYFALLDDPTLTAREALAVSKRITYGHKLELLCLDLSFFGWYLLIAITCGIVGIWKMPYINATYAHAFNWMMQLERQNNAPPVQEYPF